MELTNKVALVTGGTKGIGAAAALADYLSRYPAGRFVREARERLAQLDAGR